MQESEEGRTYGGDGGDDEAPAAADLWVHCAQLCVLPDHTGILLMQAHRLLDLKRLTCKASSMHLAEHVIATAAHAAAHSQLGAGC